ncbi:glycoside hydrolase family 3 N-terminal domain-containing protein [Streptomyces sp. NPDC093225]|uniref:glycoside hydrolase family 3 N-terminal domain-containing protein n=1 Tax=Streptomyces sp. NPDC093225 TaxID=3366034 RepID=UPI00382181ED
MTAQQAASPGARTTWRIPLVAVSLVAACLGCAGPSRAVVEAPPPGAAAATTKAATCADTVFDAMTEPQRIGQLFMGGVAAARPDPSQIRVLQENHVGSVFLAGRSTAGTAATRTLVDGLQAGADTVAGRPVRLLVATDQEGGQVQVLSGPGFSTIPKALTQGTWSPEVLRSRAEQWAEELESAGVDLNLAPVADVVPASLGTKNAPIGRFGRQFGFTPATVTVHSDAFLKGSAQAGVLTTLKHFPGLGRVTGNTDTTAGVTDTETGTGSASLEPFRSGIKAGASFVMVSLATYSKIDPHHQAVFSAPVIQGMLRTTMGFKGVVISDDLGNAVAVKAVPPGNRAVDFLKAGGDLVLTVNPSLVPTMAKAVRTRAAQDAAFAQHVDQSVHRILSAKAQAGLLSCG